MFVFVLAVESRSFVFLLLFQSHLINASLVVVAQFYHEMLLCLGSIDSILSLVEVI